jgi:hypothetical protein
MDLLTSPGATLDVNDNLNYKRSVHYEDFDVPENGHNAASTKCSKQECCCSYTTLDIDKLRFGDEVVPKAFRGIQDPHNNIKKPGKWLASNMCSPSPRYADILLYTVYILTN